MLMAMGVPPKVSSSTGMYLIAFSTFSTSFLYLVFGNLVVDYGLWAAGWSCFGSIVGLHFANIYLKKHGGS